MHLWIFPQTSLDIASPHLQQPATLPIFHILVFLFDISLHWSRNHLSSWRWMKINLMWHALDAVNLAVRTGQLGAHGPQTYIQYISIKKITRVTHNMSIHVLIWEVRSPVLIWRVRRLDNLCTWVNQGLNKCHWKAKTFHTSSWQILSKKSSA